MSTTIEIGPQTRLTPGPLVSFESGIHKNGTESPYEASRKLGKSSATVYLTSDKNFTLKIFDSQYVDRFRVEVREVLITEYLLGLGFKIPKIVDFSSNVFSEERTDNPKYLVKEYIAGLNYDQRVELGVDTDHGPSDRYISDLMLEELPRQGKARFHAKLRNMLKTQIAIYDKALKKGFHKWVSNHRYGPLYLQIFEESIGTRVGDIWKKSNWLLTTSGWVLIDP